MCNKGTREGIQGPRAYHYSIKSHHKDGYLSTQERDDDVVDHKHRDDDYEDVGQEVD